MVRLPRALDSSDSGWRMAPISRLAARWLPAFRRERSTRGSRALAAHGVVRLYSLKPNLNVKVFLSSGLVALLVLAACGGEHASPPAGTQVPNEPGVTVPMSPTPEPPVGPNPTPVGMDTPDPEPTVTSALTSTANLTVPPTPMQVPSATPTATRTPTGALTPTATLTPTVETTPTPAPPAIGGLDKTVTSRGLEYDYTIELSDSWSQERTGTDRNIQQHLSLGPTRNLVPVPPAGICRGPVHPANSVRPPEGLVAHRFTVRDHFNRGEYEG